MCVRRMFFDIWYDLPCLPSKQPPLQKSAGHCNILRKALSAQELINQCRRLSAVSRIEVYCTAISRPNTCTRLLYSTVQYSTDYSTIFLVCDVCPGSSTPCWCRPAPRSPSSRCPALTRAPPPGPAPRGDTCIVTCPLASRSHASYRHRSWIWIITATLFSLHAMVSKWKHILQFIVLCPSP